MDYGPDLCTDCAEVEHVFERGFTCVEYGAAERELIHRFKYKEQAYLGRKMAEIMYDRIIAEELEADLILPVPMFRRKERQRGYNQAAVLAANLAKHMGIPCDTKTPGPHRETEGNEQAGLRWIEEKISGIFFSRTPNRRGKLAANRFFWGCYHTTEARRTPRFGVCAGVLPEFFAFTSLRVQI